MPTIDEVFEQMSASIASDAHDTIVVDPVERVLIVPKSERIFGVERDADSERKYFCCPATVGDNIKLANSSVRIDIINAEGGIYDYDVDDVTIDGDKALFSWLIREEVAQFVGDIKFALHIESGSKQWNTTYATGTVLPGYC